MKKYICLTQTIHEGIPDWEGNCGFHLQKIMDYPDGFRLHGMNTPCGIGTHMDAPSHFFQGGKSIHEIELSQLIAPGIIIDVSAKAHEDYSISVDDIHTFEKKHGKIKKNSVVIAKTGWGIYWGRPKKYRNVSSQGIKCFPRYSKEAANLLITRSISGIAIDTLSPDGSDENFPVHHLLLSNDKFIIENIKIPSNMPPLGFQLFCLPLNIQDATEAPCRVIAEFV